MLVLHRAWYPKKETFVKYLAFFALLLIPVASFGESDQVFPYKVLVATTGNGKMIHFNGEWIDVDFVEASDQKALHALYGLRWQVLDKNAEGNIFVIGRRLESFKFERYGRQNIYDFVLTGWYITTPFEYYIEPDGWVPGDHYLVGKKTKLDDSCFRWSIDDELMKYYR